ncbi:MAG: GHKL domain-containing protein [Deltaproteobacteria bacterium]|nr:GHKL domain-containing protein [Deltaproteobacteria bacterium]
MAEKEVDRYQAVFRSLVWRIAAVSLFPLLAIGGVNFFIFSTVNRDIVVEHQSNTLRHHRESIRVFLKNIEASVSGLARQYSLKELKEGNLQRLFPVIKLNNGIITDIGIIDQNGDAVLYVGPYNLAAKNYRATEWFKQTVERGLYLSDMFLGYRHAPHFVIAVKRVEGDLFWILRVTVNTDYFSRLVDNLHSGRTGETFIINRAGLYQTKSRFANDILKPSGYPFLQRHPGISLREVRWNNKRYLCTTTWLSHPDWLLIYRQELGEVYAPLWRASAIGLGILAIGAIAALLLAIFVSQRQVRVIRQADREKELLANELMVTGKTAAVGELSAGVAHEINNPLASIETLRVWISDLVSQDPLPEEDRREILDAAQKIGEQVERCKQITQGLLKFSRRVETSPENSNVNTILEELSTMGRARARLENAKLETELGAVPQVFASPLDLQQIFANLVNNALDALAGRPASKVKIRSYENQGRACIEISDNGCGISEENLARVFLPFFTTKPVGQGTGLGLAICYGLVQKLGGTITVQTKLDAGTTFTVSLPAARAAGPE